ncbi:MAG: hypothetical protein Q8T11_12995 [Elusimicrobiota bacterium]|nr:hypothetical protein [Elusimicrobiota bacterium]
MKRAVAALFCLALQVHAWGFSTTMPTDVPVTIIVDKPTRGSGGGGGSPREPREPREYSSPSASSADPAEALETLAVIVAAPVIVVGGALYLAGKAFKDWLEERRLARERAERDAAEYRRWREEEDRREAAAIAGLQRRENAGREAEWGRVGALLDALVDSAEAAELGGDTYPYEGLALETERVVRLRSGKNKFARQNEFNADILAAYKEIWADPSFRTTLRLVTPLHYKGLIAWESSFNPDNEKNCGFARKKCGGKSGAKLIGVGLLSMVHGNATDPKGAALRVTSKVDERLDSAKAIRGGLRSLRLVEEKLTDIYQEAHTAPDDEALREFIMLGHNVGYTALRRALREGPRDYKKPLSSLRLADLMKPRTGKPPLLEEILNKGDQPEKFQKEAREYLKNVADWIEAAKPKPPKESKP